MPTIRNLTDGTNKFMTVREIIKRNLRAIIEQIPGGAALTLQELIRLYNVKINELLETNNFKDSGLGDWITQHSLNYRKKLKIKDSRTMRAYLEEIIHNSGNLYLKLSKTGDVLTKATIDKSIIYDHAEIGHEGHRSVDFYDKEGHFLVGPYILVSNMVIPSGTISPRCGNNFFTGCWSPGTFVVQSGTIGIRFNPTFKGNEQSLLESVKFVEIKE